MGVVGTQDLHGRVTVPSAPIQHSVQLPRNLRVGPGAILSTTATASRGGPGGRWRCGRGLRRAPRTAAGSPGASLGALPTLPALLLTIVPTTLGLLLGRVVVRELVLVDDQSNLRARQRGDCVRT